MPIPYIIITLIVLLFIFYKLKLEKRYDWVEWEDNVKDLSGKSCSRIVYTDKHLGGLQTEYFYNMSLTSNLVSHHIRSKNRAYRRNILKRYTNK